MRREVVPGGTRGITTGTYRPPGLVRVSGTRLQSGSPPDCGGEANGKSSSIVAPVGTPVIHSGTPTASTLPGLSITTSNAVRRLERISAEPITSTLSCGAAPGSTVKPEGRLANEASGLVTVTSHSPCALPERSN